MKCGDTVYYDYEDGRGPREGRVVGVTPGYFSPPGEWPHDPNDAGIEIVGDDFHVTCRPNSRFLVSIV